MGSILTLCIVFWEGKLQEAKIGKRRELLQAKIVHILARWPLYYLCLKLINKLEQRDVDCTRGND